MTSSENEFNDRDKNENVHFSNPTIRIILIVSGSLLVALGVLGVLLPVMPTTPFLLLAAACYARSSHRFYHWLIHNRLFGSYIRNYREGKGIPLKIKALAISTLWLSIGSTVVFAIDNGYVRILLLLVAMGVTAHLIGIKTKHT